MEVNNTIIVKSKVQDQILLKSKVPFSNGLLETEQEINTQYSKRIVFGIALKNGSKTIRRTLESIISQENVRRELVIIIANDNSNDNWKDKIFDLLKLHNIIIQEVSFGKVYLVRNYINKYIRSNIKNVDYIARLDSDDYLIDSHVISRLENIIDSEFPDVIMLGNKLSFEGKLLSRINYGEIKLLDISYLRKKLGMMNEGIAEAELPSCNVLIKPSVLEEYPCVDSAEDHWFTVQLLLNQSIDIHINEELLYCVYSLSGETTYTNKKTLAYKASRRALYEYVTNKSKTKYE